jgi:four helix bundle protein
VSERYSYRNLILWQRAQELAYDVIQVTKRLPQSWASAIIARQIIGSVTSIAANIAEGHGRFSIGAYRNHLSIARGSATETDSWLDLMRREGILSIQEEEALHSRCRQIIGMLTTKMNSLDHQRNDTGNEMRESAIVYSSSLDAHPSFPFEQDDYQEIAD